jgi:hypothetical protein
MRGAKPHLALRVFGLFSSRLADIPVSLIGYYQEWILFSLPIRVTDAFNIFSAFTNPFRKEKSEERVTLTRSTKRQLSYIQRLPPFSYLIFLKSESLAFLIRSSQFSDRG